MTINLIILMLDKVIDDYKITGLSQNRNAAVLLFENTQRQGSRDSKPEPFTFVLMM